MFSRFHWLSTMTCQTSERPTSIESVDQVDSDERELQSTSSPTRITESFETSSSTTRPVLRSCQITSLTLFKQNTRKSKFVFPLYFSLSLYPAACQQLISLCTSLNRKYFVFSIPLYLSLSFFTSFLFINSF
jgi:hypothetical protein